MDSARVYVRPELCGFEHIHAHFERYRYARHAHAGIVIGLVDDGIQSYTYRGARHRTGRDGIFFVNAGELHTGEAAGEGGYTYRGVQLDPSFIARLLGGAGIERLAFKDAVVQSTVLAGQFRRALLAIEQGAPVLHCEELIFDSLSALVTRHGEYAPVTELPTASRRAIERAREFIEQSSVEGLSLATLSQAADLSVFHFAHSFRRQVGCSPFAYAEAIRIERAKSRLKAGAALADLAAELGYADQSHFTRKFRQHQAITPGRYRAFAMSWRSSIESLTPSKP
jgi:AraC-like DNA-binding protein